MDARAAHILFAEPAAGMDAKSRVSIHNVHYARALLS
jgi:hypothetical protein